MKEHEKLFKKLKKLIKQKKVTSFPQLFEVVPVKIMADAMDISFFRMLRLSRYAGKWTFGELEQLAGLIKIDTRTLAYLFRQQNAERKGIPFKKTKHETKKRKELK